ncbi:MAG: tRNA (adenosine(37)-N6)-dimethylallyltransferase MiaA, partial [Massilibacteroides sp.]|nr:tRNA (adenosine(37)-N6)-dimethylallyltransferase MiaA [Massilibacteroides sp.]
ELQEKSLKELELILASYKDLHNKTDVDSVQRAIRAIEIEAYYKKEVPAVNEFEAPRSLIIGIDIDRQQRREKITSRLKQRLEEGLLAEVQTLLDKGIAPENLIYYGLEYKYVTLCLIGQLTYDEMFRQLEIAIHQFAKRQMTWFRGMERRGITIHWLDATLSTEEKIKLTMKDL